MLRAVLRDMVTQNRMTGSFTFDRVTDANAGWRLNADAASVGFIYRSLAETLNRFGNFLGAPSEVVNTTIAQKDEGQSFDVATSRRLVDAGYAMLEQVVDRTTDDQWLAILSRETQGRSRPADGGVAGDVRRESGAAAQVRPARHVRLVCRRAALEESLGPEYYADIGGGR